MKFIWMSALFFGFWAQGDTRFVAFHGSQYEVIPGSFPPEVILVHESELYVSWISCPGGTEYLESCWFMGPKGIYLRTDVEQALTNYLYVLTAANWDSHRDQYFAAFGTGAGGALFSACVLLPSCSLPVGVTAALLTLASGIGVRTTRSDMVDRDRKILLASKLFVPYGQASRALNQILWELSPYGLTASYPK